MYKPRSIALLTLLLVAGCSLGEPTPLERATTHFRMGHWDAAVELCDQLLNEHPNNADAWLLRGRCFLGKKMPQRAIADYTEAIKLRPEDPEPLYHRAIAYQQINRADLAEADKLRAHNLDIEVKKALAMRNSPFSEYEVVADSDSKRSPAGRRHPAEPSGKDPLDLPGDLTDPTALGTEPDVAATDRVPSAAKPPSPVTQPVPAGQQPGFQLPSTLPDGVNPAAERGLPVGHLVRSIAGVEKLDPSSLRGRRVLDDAGRVLPWQETRSEPAPPEEGEQGRQPGDENPRAQAQPDERETESVEPEETEPDQPPVRPLPSGMFLPPNNTASMVPHTGYPFSGPVTPRPTTSSLSRLYSVPNTTLFNVPAYPLPTPGVNARPTRPGPRSLSTAGRYMPGPRRHGPSFRAGRGRMGRSASTASPQIEPHGMGLPPEALSGLGVNPTMGQRTLGPVQPTVGGGVGYQPAIPSLPSDVPTTGVVHSYDGM